MRKSYDDIKDEHVGHTKENPDQTCLICDRKGWNDEYKEKRKEIQRLKKKGRKIIQIKENKQKLKDLQKEMNNNGYSPIRQEKIEYNRTLKKLKKLGAEVDKPRKIVGSDEASGYGKKVY